MKTEPLLTYALKDGRMMSIEAVARGLQCGCICPKCKQPLEARKGTVRQPHFAHLGEKAGYKNCQGYYMTALHLLAEQIIEEKRTIMFPGFKSIPQREFKFIRVEREMRIDRSDIQPDIVGVDVEGNRWMIEIRNTHKVNEDKIRKIKEINANCLEIDVSNESLDNLENFIIKSVENRAWINVPSYVSEIIRNNYSLLYDYFKRLNEGLEFRLPRYNDTPVSIIISSFKIIDGSYIELIGSNQEIIHAYVAKNEKDILEFIETPENSQIGVLLLLWNGSEKSHIHINPSLTTSFWLRFPTEGILYDNYINNKVILLRNNYPGIVGKLDSNCQQCRHCLPNGKCKYVLQDISYNGIIYHMCTLDVKGEKNEPSHPNVNLTHIPLKDFVLKMNCPIPGYPKDTFICNFHVIRNGFKILHAYGVPPRFIVTTVTFPNGIPKFIDHGTFDRDLSAESVYNKLS